VQHALEVADAAPWPDAAAAYTDVLDSGAGQWR
jgi:acetoin:2,6-dichlorophenolindophenol oxidoreductase subunit alpha